MRLISVFNVILCWFVARFILWISAESGVPVEAICVTWVGVAFLSTFVMLRSNERLPLHTSLNASLLASFSPAMWLAQILLTLFGPPQIAMPKDNRSNRAWCAVLLGIPVVTFFGLYLTTNISLLELYAAGFISWLPQQLIATAVPDYEPARAKTS